MVNVVIVEFSDVSAVEVVAVMKVGVGASSNGEKQ